jgi:LmbE family N-acetylglucosaminyl deacetylase
MILILIAIIALGFYIFYIWYYKSVPQAGISLLNIIPDPKKTDTILIFSPHPDDETIATGGFIKTATLNGAKVWIVLVTNGNKHHLEKARYNEFAAVTSALGVPENHLIYLNYPDGELQKEDQKGIQTYFRNIITFVRPNVVFIPIPNDKHHDHKTTGLDAEAVILDMKLRANIYYYLVHFPNFPVPMSLNKNLYLTPPIKLLDFSKEWSSFPLPPTIEDAKLNALIEYKTQLKYLPLKEIMEAFVRRNELFVINK